MKLKFMKIDEKAVIPKFASEGAACFDFHIVVDNQKNRPATLSEKNKLTHTVTFCQADGTIDMNKPIITIEPHCSVVFHTGLKCEIEPGYVLKIYPRSSTGIKTALSLSNGTGVIDSDYRGEIMIALTNNSEKPRVIYGGDRVAQGQIQQLVDVEIEEAFELSETERGEGGIGSSGR